MAASVFELILARVAALLLAGSTAAGSNIFRARDDAFKSDELPALNIRRANTSGDVIGNSGERHVIEFEIEHIARGAGWESAADVASHRKAASAGNNAELFYSINAATVNGSGGHTFTLAGVTSDTSAASGNTTLHYSEAYANEPHLVRVDVYGSRSRPEMQVHLINHEGVKWAGVFYARSSNEAFYASFTFPRMHVGGAASMT